MRWTIELGLIAFMLLNAVFAPGSIKANAAPNSHIETASLANSAVTPTQIVAGFTHNCALFTVRV